jgi:hypothetical protein
VTSRDGDRGLPGAEPSIPRRPPLRLAHRPFAPRPPLTSPWAAWALAVADRHRVAWRLRARVDRVLRRAATFLYHRFVRQAAGTLAPRLEVTVLYEGPGREARPGAPAAGAPPPDRVGRSVVVERLLARRERVEWTDPVPARRMGVPAVADRSAPPGSAGQPRDAAHDPVASSGRAVARVVRRSEPQAPPPAAGGGPQEGRWEAWPEPIRPWPQPSPAGEGDVDVERLTDRVIKAIDRRVLAYRERTGKV